MEEVANSCANDLLTELKEALADDSDSSQSKVERLICQFYLDNPSAASSYNGSPTIVWLNKNQDLFPLALTRAISKLDNAITVAEKNYESARAVANHFFGEDDSEAEEHKLEASADMDKEVKDAYDVFKCQIGEALKTYQVSNGEV